MNQLNEFAAKASTLAKNSYERSTELNQLMTDEATKIAEHQMEQSRDLLDLGFQAQKNFINEWVSGVTNARDMWWESMQSWNRSLEKNKA
jgi:hypothetical protein